MDYLRQTVDSDILTGVFDLPVALRNRKVEVTITPAELEITRKQRKASVFGSLHKYADVTKIPQEKTAWLEAAAGSNKCI